MSLLGCKPQSDTPQKLEPKLAGDRITLPKDSPQLASIVVETVGAEQKTLMPQTGRLTWDESATVRVFSPFSGIARRLLAEVGERVQKDQPLLEIQSPDFCQAQAEARKFATDFRRAELNLLRVRDLFEHGAAAGKELELAEADFASRKADNQRATTRLQIYGASPLSTNQAFLLPSPVAGVVVERNVTPGQEVRPDQMLANVPQITAPLFMITDPTRLWLQIDATEADLQFLRLGAPFELHSRAFPGRTFSGQIEVVSGYVDPTTRNVKVRGSVDNAERLLKAEMFVTVTLPGSEAPTANVPVSAVFLKGNKHYVFVEEQPGQFARHEIQPGSEHAGRRVVVSGLSPGQRVVSDGCVLLEEALK